MVLQKTLESPLDQKEIKPVNPKGNQSWIFTGRTEAESEASIHWPPDVKSQLIWKDPDAGKDRRQEEKGMTEDGMVGWHHQLNGHEFEQAPKNGQGQGSLVCCSPWGCKASNTTECTHTHAHTHEYTHTRGQGTGEEGDLLFVVSPLVLLIIQIYTMWMITYSKWVKACMSEHKKSPWQTPQELFWVFLSNISSLEGDRGQLPTQFGVDLLQSSGGMSPCVSLWSPSNPVELSPLASWTTWVSFPQSLGSQSCAWDLLGGFINCTTFQANLQTLRFKRGGQPGAPPPGMRLSKPLGRNSGESAYVQN